LCSGSERWSGPTASVWRCGREFLFVPEVVILGVRVGWRRVVPATAVVILAGLALVPLAASQRANGQSSWIEGASLISRVAETAKEFLVGLYSPLEIVSAVLAALLAAAAVALLRRVSDAHEQRLARDAAIVAGAGLLLPLILALAHLVDVFDGRNVIAAWLPFALLIAIGLGAPRAGRRGLLVGTALCAVSLAVIASVNVLPAYQRDNWRGAAQALPPAGSRILVSQQNASLPLSIYLRWVRPVTGTEVSGSELVFIALRTRRTGRSPLAAVVPTTPPSGFRLVQYSQTTSYAVSRFLARRPVAISVKLLQRMSEPGVATPQAEAMIQG
jgi:drug/metabolite transporter (DMT)-like permease